MADLLAIVVVALMVVIAWLLWALSQKGHELADLNRTVAQMLNAYDREEQEYIAEQSLIRRGLRAGPVESLSEVRARRRA